MFVEFSHLHKVEPHSILIQLYRDLCGTVFNLINFNA